MERRLVGPRIPATSVGHRDTLLKDPRHAGGTACAHPDACTFATELIVLRVVTLRRRTGQAGGEVDRDVTADESSSQRRFVEYVGRCQLGSAGGCYRCGRGPSHQRADEVAGRGQPRYQMAAINACRAEDSDARAHVVAFLLRPLGRFDLPNGPVLTGARMTIRNGESHSRARVQARPDLDP